MTMEATPAGPDYLTKGIEWVDTRESTRQSRIPDFAPFSSTLARE